MSDDAPVTSNQSGDGDWQLPNRLSILYYNARSVLYKFDEQAAHAVFMHVPRFHLPWLFQDISDKELNIDNYCLIHLDRIDMEEVLHFTLKTVYHFPLMCIVPRVMYVLR